MTNFKASEIRRQRDELVLFEKGNHLGFATFVSLQKVVLIFWDDFGARRIRIGKRWVGQHRFHGASAREFRLAEHLDLLRVQRQKINVLEQIVVIRFAHRREWRHRSGALFQPIGVGMNRVCCRIAGSHEIVHFLR